MDGGGWHKWCRCRRQDIETLAKCVGSIKVGGGHSLLLSDGNDDLVWAIIAGRRRQVKVFVAALVVDDVRPLPNL